MKVCDEAVEFKRRLVIISDHHGFTGPATACVGMEFTWVVPTNDGVQDTLVRGGGFMAVGLGKMNWFCPDAPHGAE